MALLCKIFPQEILEKIWDYIPNSSKVWVNKYYYEKYHYSLVYPKLKLNYNSYMRFIIRNEYLYLMKINIQEHYDVWSNKIVNIKYKKHTFPKYVDYIKSLSLENNSNKIYSLLKSYENRNKINKSLKSNRKIKYKYNKWTN